MKRILLFLSVLVLVPTLAWSDDFDRAGAHYGVNPDLLRAIAWVESNNNNDAVNTNNGRTEDRCKMQINDQHKDKLNGGWEWLKKDPAYCTMVGAWILAGCQAAYGNTWDAVACYNTGRGIEDLREAVIKYRAEGYDTTALERRLKTGINYARRVQAALEFLEKQARQPESKRFRASSE